MLKILSLRRKRWLGLLLVPLVLWSVLLLIVPTDWARARLEKALCDATGRAVRLSAVRLGFFGGLRLKNLEMGEADPANAPWLRIEELRIDVGLATLLCSRCASPSVVEAVGVELRVHRRADGTLEFGDLLQGSTDSKATHSSSRTDAAPVEIRLSRAKLDVVDEPSDTHLEFHDLQGRATWRGRSVSVPELRGKLNGGTVSFSGSLERGDSPAFEANLQAKSVDLGVGMNALTYAAPMLAGAPSRLTGTLDLAIYARAHGSTSEEIERSLAGQGSIELRGVALDQSKIVAEIGKIAAIPAEERIGAVSGAFVIGDRRVSGNDWTLTLANLPIVFSGSTDFDGRLDYIVRCDPLTDRIPDDVRQMLSELPGDVKNLTSLHVRGTSRDLLISLDDIPLAKRGGSLRPEEKARLRSITKRLRERFFR